jgi:hypothetical protein
VSISGNTVEMMAKKYNYSLIVSGSLIFLLELLILYFLESITFLLPMPDVAREYSLQIEMSKQA